MANKKKALQNDFAAQHNQEKMHMASNLVTLQQIINSGATAEELNQKIDLILKDTLPATEIQRKPIGEE